MKVETVGDLRTLLRDAPDDMPVLVYAGYIAPADGEVYVACDGRKVCQLSLLPAEGDGR